MPTVEIIAYTLHTGRLGRLGTEKLIVLRHRRALEGGVTDVASSEVYFSDRFGEHGGFTVATNGGGMRAHLPEQEYAHWVDILRYEDPVFLHWTSEEGVQDPDGIVHLATGPEPPGEGPTDLSP